MPKIYEYFGLAFLFFSKEHTPIHVHVKSGSLENKIELIYEKGSLKELRIKKIKGKTQLTPSMLKDAIRLVKVKESDITTKWLDFFGKRKPLKCEIITRKL